MKHCTYLALFASLILTACGGGGGGKGDSSPPSRATGSISGVVFDAPVSGASVKVWEYKNGKVGRLLGQATTASDGQYSVAVKTASMPVLIDVEGGLYEDPFSNKRIELVKGSSLKFQSLINYAEGANQTAMVTPLTYAAAGLAKYKIRQGMDSQQAINASNDEIASRYGFNALTVRPSDVIKATQGVDIEGGYSVQNQYGLLLAAYSSYARDVLRSQVAADSNFVDTDNTYTSAYLARVQYEDALADGKMDGIFLYSGLDTSSTFGPANVTADTYSEILAQHIMIAANELDITTDFSVYSKQVQGKDDDTSLDSTPPSIDRAETRVLLGKDSIEFNLSDNIGVKNASARLAYKLDEQWHEIDCSESNDFCELDKSEFHAKKRETKIKVIVYTKQLDDIERDTSEFHRPIVNQAKLYVTVEDTNTTANQSTEEFTFQWDNEKPIVTITSADTISSNTDYNLEGSVEDEFGDISQVKVFIKGAEQETLNCTKDDNNEQATGRHKCIFAYTYENGMFKSGKTTIKVTAADKHEYIGEATKIVKTDIQKPSLSIGYPSVDLDFVIDREVRTGYKYDAYTFTNDNIDGVLYAIKADKYYVENGVTELKPITPEKLVISGPTSNTRQIPYITATVSDEGDQDSGLASEPKDITLSVTHYTKQKGGNWQKHGEALETSIDDKGNSALPYAIVNDELTYYIPFTKDVMKSTSTNRAHKLVISARDEAGNTSDQSFEVYYKLSYNLPKIKVVTPFINASVSLEVPDEDDNFESTGDTCDTKPDPSSPDVASCVIEVQNPSASQIYRLRLLSDEAKNTHYYGWGTSNSDKPTVDLGTEAFAVYFKGASDKTFYITELASYHSGLFDYQWNRSNDKNVATAEDILKQVSQALAGSDSFFGFDPTITPYETNLEASKRDETVGSLNNSQRHRLLVESLTNMATMASSAQVVNSVEFAKRIYADLSSDGKADGSLDSEGETQTVVLGHYEFSTDTYTKDLANFYYYAMSGEDSFGYFTSKYLSLPKRNRPYTVEKKAALIYADRVATANPKFFNKEVIDQKNLKSIDNKPPQIVIDSGVHEITVADKTYVTANKMVFTVTSTDPAEIGKVEIKVFYKENEASEEFIKIDTLNIVKDPTQQGKYSFELDTSSGQYSAIKIFKVEVDATDNKSNAGKATKEYHLDKAPPVVILKRPNEDGDENVYLSAAGSQYPELTFKIEDQVGDDKQQRLVQFSNVSSGDIEKFTHQKFSVSAESEFKVKLCSSDNCDEKAINLNDGEWALKVKAVDQFGQVTELDKFEPFKILIDSTPPVVEDLDGTLVLAANASWTPPIDWQDGAAGDEVKIELKRPNDVFERLEKCDSSNKSECTESYITGEKDKIKVQLVADDLQEGDGKTHKFKVTASDSAYPRNTSKPKELSFTLDGSGPELRQSQPWIEDQTTTSDKVIGKNFSFKFASAKDPSGVKKVNIYQLVNEELVELKTWIGNNPGWWNESFTIVYSLGRDPNIVIDSNNKVTFVIEAVDNSGFSTKTKPQAVTLDTEGPKLQLGGYGEDAYYSSGYKFTVNAEDYARNGVITSAGVDKSSLQYWFNDQDNNKTQVKEEEGNYYITLPSVHADDDMKLFVSGKDIRGNERVEHFPLKISNSAPQLSNLNIFYANGQKVEKAVTRTGDIKITLDAQDNSGIAKVELLIDYNGGKSRQKFEINNEEKWQTTLTLQQDGEYSLNIKAYNKVHVTSDQSAMFSEMDHTLHVQRQGVELRIIEPTPFSSHVSGKTLSAGFDVQNHVQPKQIQCWIRENYTSTEAPQDRDMYTSGTIILNSGEAPRCSITSSEDFNQNPVLIVETLGQNDATNVQLFSFKQLDSQPPEPDFTEEYAVTKDNINPASGDTPKQFFMVLAFKDNMSGVNINAGTWPILEQGITKFKPTECKSSQNRQFTCTYGGNYSSFIGGIDPNLNYQITNLVDNAGNEAEPYNLKLVLPNKAPEVSINSKDSPSSKLPELTIVQGGEEYTVILKTVLDENSSIDEIEVKVGDRVYLSSNQQDIRAFGDAQCDDALCTAFNFDVPEEEGIDNLTLSVTVRDVFDTEGKSSLRLQIDKDDPTIGSIQSIERRGENIRFTFDISDQTSGLSEVTYKVKGIETPIIKQEQGNGEALYFELKASDLGLEPLTVDIIAKDKVGRSSLNWGKKINLTLPQISLTLSPETNFVGERLAVKDEKLSVTLNSENEGSLITAKSYSVMVAGSKLEGEFSDTSWPLEVGINSDRQGQSSLIIKVTDSLGREMTEFNYSDKEYDADGIPVLVDFVDPEIKSLSASKSGMVKEEGKYPVEVTAEVSDLHLSQVTAVLLNDEGTQVSQVSLKSSDNVYTTTLNVAAGDYQVKVVALDRAGRKSEKKTDVKVEESPTPSVNMSLLDAPLDNKIGGGQNVTLEMKFSEAVKEFDSGDVLMLIGEEEHGPASLKDLKAIDKDGKQWQASYTTPSDTDTKVTFKIEQGSYLSKNNILGTGAELTLDIKGTKPQVSSVKLPDSATVGEPINVSVTFTEEVTKPSGSTLGDALVTWSEGDELREVWTGQVTVPSTDASTLKLNLSIKGYQDKYANVGVENTNNSVSLNHVLSINEIGNVGQNSPKTIAIGGKWAHLQGQLTLTVSSKNDSISENVALSEDGTWSQAVSIEGLPQGRITVTVSGKNAKDEVVEGAVQTFIFDDAAPVIDDESLTVLRDDENGTVTLGFDIQDEASGLTQVTYKFNDKEINKDGTDNNQLQLMANDLAGKDELKIHITAVDELGQSTEVAKTINIAQPKVSLSLQGAADLMEGLLPLTQLPQSMTLRAPSAEGSVVQAAGYRLALVPSGDSSNAVTLAEFNLPSGSNENTTQLNLAQNQIPQGEFTLRLVVTDSLGREITQFNYSDKEYDAGGIPVLVDFVDPQVSAVDWKKSQVSAGEDVALKVTFSEPVSQPLGSTLGDAAVIWSEGDELRQEWTGQVTVPVDVDTSLESLTLSVKDYADRVGNLGDLNNDFSLPLTAPVEAPDNSGTGESSEMSEASSDPSEHDQGTLENKKEEMRIAA